ncbi:flagellar assembly protein FliW [Paenibacillus sp. NPDC056722]|uniref:flagellar assembly protein FliW n=1 Tax=Paenibacillus sp. NPDC056722 TaxID=3345924 RepID=UPI0036D09524
MSAEQACKEAEIVTDPIYLFPKGIPGFEGLQDFRLQEHNDIFTLLTAVDQPSVAFITVNPFDFISDYEFVLPEEAIQDIEVQDREQIIIRCIVTWHSDKSKITVNLLAPLIFNTDTHKGKQIILQSTVYTTKYPLWTEIAKGNEGGDF